MSIALCTLFEKDYHLGFASQVNSLHRNGFRGRIFAGYRGPLPEWICKSDRDLGNSIEIVPLLLDTPWHFTNYKPQFMLDVLGKNPDVSHLLYLDPDVFLKCPFSYIEAWVREHVALVEELTTQGMPQNHPIRIEWGRLAKTLGISWKPGYVFNQYFNAGFVGMPRAQSAFLETWLTFVEAMPSVGIALDVFMPYGRPHPFSGVDQDCLNMAAMVHADVLSTMGPEGMDFIPGGFTFSHAVGGFKPWRTNYIKKSLAGFPPTASDRAFWLNACGPVQPWNPATVRARKLSLSVATAISRFFKK